VKPIATLELPLPSPWLSPNKTVGSRGGRMAKSVATKKYREAARLIALSQLPTDAPHDTLSIQCRFFHKDIRRRDKDNLLASMKAAFDGIADAGWVKNDSELTYMPVLTDKDRDNPRVEIDIYGEAAKESTDA
jgi:crossover junction endodeoxyribonuclease RusA